MRVFSFLVARASECIAAKRHPAHLLNFQRVRMACATTSTDSCNISITRDRCRSVDYGIKTQQTIASMLTESGIVAFTKLFVHFETTSAHLMHSVASESLSRSVVPSRLSCSWQASYCCAASLFLDPGIPYPSMKIFSSRTWGPGKVGSVWPPRAEQKACSDERVPRTDRSVASGQRWIWFNEGDTVKPEFECWCRRRTGR